MVSCCAPSQPPEGRWRLKTTVGDVDAQFLRMLVAYEDRRFYDHDGVDPWAIGRAAIQLLTNGRIVSGASTLSMQVARLIEPRQGRSLSAKMLQVVRALQIERRLSKKKSSISISPTPPMAAISKGVGPQAWPISARSRSA
jgi:penicillin-binding protein 1C